MKTRFGLINIIPGENKSRFPCCTSLYLDDDVKVLIDPGAGYQRLNELRHKVSIDIVINTHYHFDHIAFNYLFEDAHIIINDKEAECFHNRKIIGSLLGMEEVYGSAWVKDWLSRIAKPDTQQSPFSPQNSHRWWISTSRVDGEYTWGDVMDFGKTHMHVLGAPGHSGGFSCMYFPEYGVIYVGDLDLTPFGPWYGGSDGDIDKFISTCHEIEHMDAKFFITGHEAGIVTKDEFQKGMVRFLDIIEHRDRKIISLLSQPISLEELVDQGPIYGKKYHGDAWIYMWEFIMVKKHILRMIDQGLIANVDGVLVAA
jgi:glyoxylase-like metal-dependent hydrolase (beta-lactamase superfamily II)